MTKYNSQAFETAHARFLDDAATLTDADPEQFAIVDAKLAERARAKRAGFVEASTDLERKALAQSVTRGEFLEHIRDVVNPTLGTYRHRLKESVERITALENRMLELEAQRATNEQTTYTRVPSIEDLVL